jgi:hypothetical protein
MDPPTLTSQKEELLVKKSRIAFFPRQPGYLIKTRGFPP